MQTIQNGVNRLRNYLLTQSWFTSRLLPSLPRSVRWGLRKLYFLPFDLIDTITGRRDRMMPPRSQNFTGSVDDFMSSARKQVRRLSRIAGLTPHSHVLDVGCGMGRLATALIDYLADDGRYYGFDIVPSGIKWAQAHVAAGHPNIHFVLADIYNKEYNPGGKLKAVEYRFPYDDLSFDLVVLVSVFTHLVPGDLEHYVAEIARVLRPGGRCYATFSLIDAEARRGMAEGRSEFQFRPMLPSPHWATGDRVEELAVAYEEPFVRDLYARHGLDRDYTVYYGAWSGRESAATRAAAAAGGETDFIFQDIVVSGRR